MDLRPEHVKVVREILARRVPNAQVWVFGSRVKGTSKPHSDLDLAIISDSPLSGLLLANIEEDFSESDLPFRVDVIDWHSVNRQFREIIQNEHAVLRSSGGNP